MTSATRLVETSATWNSLTPLASVFSPTEDALSFHFCFPGVPDKAHREETITVKELVQNVLRRAGSETSPSLTNDLEDILIICGENSA